MLDKKKEIFIRYSNESRALLEMLREDFDCDDFEKWWEINYCIIGSTHILEYLGMKRRQPNKK